MSPDRAIVLFALVLSSTRLFRCTAMVRYTGLFLGFTGAQWVNSFMMITLAFLFMYILCETAGEMVFEKIPIDKADALQYFIYGIVPLVFAIETACHLNFFSKLSGDFLVVLANQLKIIANAPRFVITQGAITFFQVFVGRGGMMASHFVLHKVIINQEETYKGLRHTWPVLIPGILFMSLALANPFLNGYRAMLFLQ